MAWLFKLSSQLIEQWDSNLQGLKGSVPTHIPPSLVQASPHVDELVYFDEVMKITLLSGPSMEDSMVIVTPGVESG